MFKKKIYFILSFLILFILMCSTKVFAADYRVAVGETLEIKFSEMNVGATYYKSCSSNNESIATISEQTKGITAYIYIKGESVGNTTVTVGAGKITGGVTASKTFSVEVYNKATKPTAISNIRYNGSNQTGVQSGTGYTLTGVSQAKNVGSYTAVATLDEGYEWEDGTTADVPINWSILPMLVTIPTGKQNLYYNGSQQTGVEAGTYYNLSGDFAGTEVKSYTATASLKDKANCTWENGKIDDVNIMWEIKKQVIVNPSLSKTSVSYTGKEINIYDFLQNFNTGTMNISFDKIQNVRSYNIHISLKDTNHYIFENNQSYIDLTFEVTAVEIADTIYARKGVITTIKFGDLGFEYDVGEAHYSSRSVDNDTIINTSYRQEELIYAYIDVTGLKEGTTIMSITAENIIGMNKKTKYYKIIVPYEIAQPIAKDNLVYNGTEQTGVDSGVGYTLENEKATNAGDYQATAKVASEDYMWNDGTRGNKTIDWEIAKKKISTPVAKENLVYNGTEQIGVDAGEGYTLENEKATNAGDYQAVAKLDSNYMWNDETTSNKTINWKIKPKQLTNPDIKITNDLVFSGELQKIKVKVKDNEKELVENVDYKLKSGYEYIYAGKYYATIEFIGNYEGIIYNNEWDIARKEITIPDTVKNLVYNGTEQVGLEESDEYNIEGLNKATNAGIYNVTVKLLDKNNYIWSDKTTTDKEMSYEIQKKKIAKPIAKENLVYNGTEQTGVDAGEGYALENEKATNAGDYQAVAKLDSNHMWEDETTIDETIQWSIAKAKYIYNEPEGYEIDYKQEKITFDPVFEISFDKEKIETDVKFESLPNSKFYIRKKGNDNYEPSEWYLVKIADRQKCNDVEVINVGQNSIRIKEQQGYEYSIDGENWQETGIFENLKENSNYIIYQRAKATDNSFKSEIKKIEIKTLEKIIEEVVEEKYEKALVQKQNPKTGDNIYIYIIISIISLISLAICKLKK